MNLCILCDTVTLMETYTRSLYQTCACIFWDSSALANPNNYVPDIHKQNPDSKISHFHVDASHRSDTSQIKLVPGLADSLISGNSFCNTRFQDVIAQSSSEADFIAFC